MLIQLNRRLIIARRPAADLVAAIVLALVEHAVGLMLISQDFTTQCLRSLLLRPFSKFTIIFFEL